MISDADQRRMDGCRALFNSPNAGEAKAARLAFKRIADRNGIACDDVTDEDAAPEPDPEFERMVWLQRELFDRDLLLDHDARGYVILQHSRVIFSTRDWASLLVFAGSQFPELAAEAEAL